MRLYFTTDIHGSDVCFRKFLNAAKFYEADVLILGGDITGKTLVPIVETAAGRWAMEGWGPRRELSADQVADVEKQIRDSGGYPVRTTPEGVALLRENPSRREEVFRDAMVASVSGWMSLAEERLRGTGVRCYIGPGNDDIFEIDPALSGSDYVVNPEDKVIDVGGGWEMITSGYANPTPWNSPRELPEDALYDRISAMARRVRNPAKSLFGLHVPPVDTPIDEAPSLDATLKPIVENGVIKSAHVGSSAVRRLIEEIQPALGLHGHIHESRGTTRLGETVCLNPGSEYSEGVLRGVVIQLGAKGIDGHLFVAG